jgi:sodium/potassium-transporting ATPase subunit alpha
MVPGDIVEVRGGENIPCDLVIFKSNEMKVNNASLTGEPIEILMAPEIPASNSILESQNACFFGTQCTEGSGLGVCIRTGDRTFIGQIANLAATAEAEETPLSQEIDRFILIISGVAIVLGVSFLILSVVIGYEVIQSIVFMIGIIVANVPEGLLATVTLSLALTATRMAEKFVLVKNLEAVETLGSTSCICSDKTGTLTQNRMTVSHIFVDRRPIDAEVNWQIHERNQQKDKPDDHIVPGYDLNDNAFMELTKAMVLSSSTFFTYDPTDDDCKKLLARCKSVPVANIENLTDAERKEMRARLIVAEQRLLYINRFCKGDASETGLVQFAQPILDLEATRKKYPVHCFEESGKETECAIPFSSQIKFNCFIRDMTADGGSLRVYLKGAPERVVERCNKIMTTEGIVDFSQMHRDEVNQANKDFGGMGERVLAFAYLDMDPAKFNKDYKFNMKGWKEFGEAYKGVSYSSYADQAGAFPMHDLVLCGVVSLNDPPRPKVDISVDKCRQAGIKVIMVTGDQPPTAAAIAEKVNIIKHPDREYQRMVDNGMSEEQAMNESTGIVVHGDLLGRLHKAQEDMDDDNPDKGKFLRDWIAKPEVVFARTTPSQKLLIVDACQKEGHVVAVTGDGVNDSPAIRKADIGIAMGTGSDVAKNAADMLLLDDNFSSIVNGVEEGRLIFDNLKKSIAYTLSSNIPEILPFILYILVQVPLPLSTVLILCIDLGTDMVPAISFAYENPELDIMERVPRMAKLDRLVNSKLICFAYLQIGVVQASAGAFTYFYVMNDFGFRPGGLPGISNQKAPLPVPGDYYDPKACTMTQKTDAKGKKFWSLCGNSQVGLGYKDKKTILLGWDRDMHSRVDVRLYYSYRSSAKAEKPPSAADKPFRGPEAYTTCRWKPNDETVPWFYRNSIISNWPICYSTEALKFAQSGYLISIVAVQWADLMICKTRNLSLAQQGMVNCFGNFGLAFETILVAILCYVPFLNVALTTRQIPFPHFAVPSFSFFIVIFFYDELRKIWLRGGMVRENGRVKLKGWVAQNTYY